LLTRERTENRWCSGQRSPWKEHQRLFDFFFSLKRDGWVATKQRHAGVLQSEVLISKFGSVNGLAASAVSAGEITALAHAIFQKIR